MRSSTPRLLVALTLSACIRGSSPEPDHSDSDAIDASDTDPGDTDTPDTDDSDTDTLETDGASDDSETDDTDTEDTDVDPCTLAVDGDLDGTTVCGLDGVLGTSDDDCDDADDGRYPGRKDLCDGEEEDCDLDVDEDCFPTLLYMTTATTTGNLGGRAGADALCEAARPAGLSCGGAHALISVSAADEVRDFTALHGFQADAPLYGYHRGTQAFTELFRRWAHATDRQFDPLVTRGTATGDDALVWTGTDVDGAFINATRYHCRGFTFGGQGYPAALNFGQSGQGNIDSGMLAAGGNAADFLWSTTTMATARDTYGLSTCCYRTGTQACPDTCPSDPTTVTLHVTCSTPAKLLCACKATAHGIP